MLVGLRLCRSVAEVQLTPPAFRFYLNTTYRISNIRFRLDVCLILAEKIIYDNLFSLILDAFVILLLAFPLPFMSGLLGPPFPTPVFLDADILSDVLVSCV